MEAADVGTRIGADVIDGVLLILISVIVGFVLAAAGLLSGGMGAVSGGGLTGTDGTWFALVSSLASLAIGLGYWALTEGNGGQSIGKRLVGIRAVYADGRPVDASGAVKRKIPFYAPALITWIPILGIIAGLIQLVLVIAGLVTYIIDQPHHRGFHDKWADTAVVKA